MSGLALLADDLTGAAEIAGILGLPVSLAGPALPDGAVHDLHLRHLEPDEARRRLGAALASLPADADVRLKTDSQLHGPVAAYLQALLDAGRRPVLCAASPAAGRTTSGGVHRVPGSDRVTEVDVRDVLAGVALRVASGGIGRLEGGVAIVADARDHADLRRLAREALDLGGTLVGSAAFLSAGSAAAERAAAMDHPPSAHGLLVVVGSSEPITDQQVCALVADRPGLSATEVSSGFARAAADVSHALREHRVAVLRGGDGQADALAAITAAVIDPAEVSVALLVTGGHTARTVLARLGVRRLRAITAPVRDVTALRTPQGGLILTKPGSYGVGTTVRDVARAVLDPTPQETT